MKLIKSESYINATPEEIANICNGCGPKGIGAFVLNKLGGWDKTEACNIHDWDYEYAEATDEAKHYCDRVFLWNLVVLAMQEGLKDLSERLEQANRFYNAVVIGGYISFWANKNAPITPMPKNYNPHIGPIGQ